MTSVFAIYSYDLSSNPAEVKRFYAEIWLKRANINEKYSWVAHWKFHDISKCYDFLLQN